MVGHYVDFPNFKGHSNLWPGETTRTDADRDDVLLEHLAETLGDGVNSPVCFNSATSTAKFFHVPTKSFNPFLSPL